MSSSEQNPMEQLVAELAKAKAECSVMRSLFATASKPATVLLIGSGGREHAIAVTLAKSPKVGQVLVAPGNGGTQTEGGKISNVPTLLDAETDHASVVACAADVGACLVVVGPEGPLSQGLCDSLAAAGIACFGPSKAAAQLEASKAFSKAFMARHGLPTAAFQTFTDFAAAASFVAEAPFQKVVVKCSGLAAGKGVLLPETKEEALQDLKEVMVDQKFGGAGEEVVVEEFMEGQEVSLLAFTDGVTVVGMPGAQDHKRAFDGDLGPNTGGMGAYAPAPCLTPELRIEAMKVVQMTVDAMAKEGTPYQGVLYAGLMLTPQPKDSTKALPFGGVRLVEFNCRFGDPETQVVLPLLKTDLFDVMSACVAGTLDKVEVEWLEACSAATVVAAAAGYPGLYQKGTPVNSLECADPKLRDCTTIFHAGTAVATKGEGQGEQLVTSGGRVMAVTGVGSSLKKALAAAYARLDGANSKAAPLFEGLQRRTDIGWRALSPHKTVRVGVLGSTRGTDFQTLLAAKTAHHPSLDNVEFVVVVSNKPQDPESILSKAEAHGVSGIFLPCAKGTNRDDYDAQVTSALLHKGVDLVLCVGWMRILSESFCATWENRCLNVHPSLLPLFAGGMDEDVHSAVLKAKQTESGCTVHWVTSQVDSGGIVVQKTCAVLSDETAESLKAKVQALEGEAFLDAISQFKQGLIGPDAASSTGSGGGGGGGGGAVTTYKDAGVDIDAGNLLVERIKPACKSTRRPGCDADLGGFGGLFDLTAAGFGAVGAAAGAASGEDDVVLVGATDGVGTKLKVAFASGCHQWVGIDLVAMCVNDLIVCGAEPLFFLDYFATGKLSVDQTASIVEGIAEGCRQAGCGLIGGETAEMPTMYAEGEYDLGGFSVGAVRKRDLLPKAGVVVQPGDVVLGLSSSGVHSNGFSLVRKLVENAGLGFADPCPWQAESPAGDGSGSVQQTLGEALLTPTKIYVKALMPLLKAGVLKAMAHITGGGLPENIPRVLPAEVAIDVNLGAWNLSPVFKWLQQQSNLPKEEMTKTFNCGVGMVLVVDPLKLDECRRLLSEHFDDAAFTLGTVVARPSPEAPQVILSGELR